MDNKLFSFAIITYRNFDGVTDTLASLFRQDYPQIELIISDDGSDNYEAEIGAIKAYVDSNRPANIVNIIYDHFDVNKGTVKNYNNAVGLANGYYFKPLGGGDTLASDTTISDMVKYLEANDLNIAFGKVEGVREDGTRVKYLAAVEDDYELLGSMTSEQLCNRLFARNCLPGPAWFAKKQLFDKNGLFHEDIRLIEDYPYWITLCLNHEKIGFTDTIKIDYKLNGVSSQGVYGVMFMEDMFKLYDNYIFPNDHRYGLFQPLYNSLKKAGLGAYMAKAKMKKYSKPQKVAAYLKYGIFFAYINLSNRKIHRKNRKEDQ